VCSLPIEIEKKYRLTKKQAESVVRRLGDINAGVLGAEFEENTLYRGGVLDFGPLVLRLRRVDGSATLTFKERIPTTSSIKHQREEETPVGDPDAMNEILGALGFEAALVYEKRRRRWQIGTAEVVLDELPFGLFMEIEASEDEIARVEELLAAARLRAEMESYPSLTLKLGKKRAGVIEARFTSRRK
jgi:adenylate cyclase class 2